MIIGVPKEIKNREFRVGATPGGVGELVRDGHTVLVESSAGEGSGFADQDYIAAGAVITEKKELFEKSGMIVKIKEPLPAEYDFFKKGQLLFTYLHLAPNPELAGFLVNSGVTALGYETLVSRGQHPLLLPMSEVAGRMAPMIGAFYLQKGEGGTGRLPGGVPGVLPASAVILGAGVVGKNAARIASGLGMDVTVLNRSSSALKTVDDEFQGKVKTLLLDQHNLISSIQQADLVIGAVYSHGSRTPVLITSDMVKNKMKNGAVIVDVSVDQGGCVETMKPTIHDNPVYVLHDVIHYGVANMPGAFPATSTAALTGVTLPYIRRIAADPVNALEDSVIKTAVNIINGEIVISGIGI